MMTLTKVEAFELLTDSIALFEADMATGKINFATKPMESMFGYTIMGDLEGRMVEALVPKELQEKHAKEHRTAFNSDPKLRMMGHSLPGSIFGLRKDGTTFPVEIMLMPRASNRVRVIVGIVFDMSDRKVASMPLGDSKEVK